jgi:hypothetical protein
MPRDPYISEKFTRDLSFARQLAQEYLQRFPKDRYETEVVANAASPVTRSTVPTTKPPVAPFDLLNPPARIGPGAAMCRAGAWLPKVRTYCRKRDVPSLPRCFSVGAPASPLLKGARRERIAR